MRRLLVGLFLVATAATPAVAADCWELTFSNDPMLIVEEAGRAESVNFELVGSFLWVAAEGVAYDDAAQYEVADASGALVCDGGTVEILYPEEPAPQAERSKADVDVDEWEATAPPVVAPYVEPLFGPR